MVSCVFHQTIPTDVYPKLFDYRYCYGRPSSSNKETVAAYSCGIARDTAAKWLQLCDTKGWKRPESPVLRASALWLGGCVGNRSLARFFATQAILTSPFVEVPLVDKKLLRTGVFEEFPTFELVTGSMLYIPLKCPHNVEGVYVEFYEYSSEVSEKREWGCVMRPFVVTLGGRVSGVEEEFSASGVVGRAAWGSVESRLRSYGSPRSPLPPWSSGRIPCGTETGQPSNTPLMTLRPP